MTHYQKGVAAFQAGQLDEAERRFRQAVLEMPGRGAAGAWCFLGIVLARRQRREDAIAALKAALKADPAHAESHYNLGLVYHLYGDSAMAIPCYEAALRYRGDYPDAVCNLAIALQEQGQIDRAVRLHRQFSGHNPHDALNCNNLAVLLQVLGRLDEAMELCRQALKINPECPVAYSTLGNILNELGSRCEALSMFERAAALEPDNLKYRFDIGLTLLEEGRWLEGWPGYEYREKKHAGQFSCYGIEWQGEPVAGKSILLYGEQGFGDVFMMFRYAEALADAGAVVSVLVSKSQQRLLQRGHDRLQVLSSFDGKADFVCSIMSLPLRFRLTPASIGASIPYLFARSIDRPASLSSDRLHVGLVWGGNPQFVNDQKRSLSHFRELSSILDIEGISFHSLQAGSRAGESHGFPVSCPLHDDWDWDDTAAFVRHLDLVVTTDTAIAHLAGAMGMPVWLLLSSAPDWRWYPYGERTPWYATMSLIRQPAPGDWGSVMRSLRERLISLTEERHCRL